MLNQFFCINLVHCVHMKAERPILAKKHFENRHFNLATFGTGTYIAQWTASYGVHMVFQHQRTVTLPAIKMRKEEIWTSWLSNVRSSPKNCQIKKYLLKFVLANIGLSAFIWTQWTRLIQKNWSNIHFHQKMPIHSVRSGEPLYIYFNGQKSNL